MKEVLLFMSALAVGVSGWFLRGFTEKYTFDLFRPKKKTSANGLESSNKKHEGKSGVDLREAPRPTIKVPQILEPPKVQESNALTPGWDGVLSESQEMDKPETDVQAATTFSEAATGRVGEEQFTFPGRDLGLIDSGREWEDFEGTDYFYEDRTHPEVGDVDLDDYARRLDDLGKTLVAHFSNQVETVRVDLLNEVKAWFTRYGALDENINQVAEASARTATQALEGASLQENRRMFVEMYNQVMQDQYPRDEKGRFKARSNG